MAHTHCDDKECKHDAQPSGKEDLQRKMMEFQMLRKQVAQAQNTLQAIDGQVGELEKNSESISAIREVKQGTEIMASIVPGVMVPATIGETSSLLLTTGAGTVVKKSVQETIGIIAEQIKELGAYREVLSQQLDGLMEQAQMLEHEIERLRNNVQIPKR
ncbi:MAG TPA: hypothetical protein VJI75_06525 [Candidatus Nanoarchaeia archaeon]|nr:hypothetical protein [Candidatus Nanoarchaeia archaeon]